MDFSGKVFNFLGDSITQGIGASSQDNKYTTVFSRKYGAEVNTYGISGTRFAKQKNHIATQPLSFEEDFCKRYVTMADADFVVVFGGTNDYGHGDAPVGDMDDRTPDTFYGACHYLFKGIIEKYPLATIIIMTPLHRLVEGPGGENTVRENNPPLKAFVEIIREVAEYYSLPVLDLYKMSGINPIIPEIQKLYMPDGIHPSDKGHEKIADMLASFIKTL